MTTLRDHLAEYLRMRRELGYRLEKLELLAGQFCDWLDAEAKTSLSRILCKSEVSGLRIVF
jgi:hypothetical protein